MSFKLIPKGFLRAAIICVLEKKPLNGYRIIKNVKELTGFWTPSPGSVYPLLKAMRKEGIIEKCENGAYVLTKKGKKLAKKLKITREHIRNSFIDLISIACEMEKSVIEKEMRKREIALKALDEKIKKMLGAIIREIVKLRKDQRKSCAVVEILEDTLRKLRKL